ncbi:MAG: hypothetical protein BA863_07355 [Desulfovibrio sp. S3730MH75]|nr:MAG: hypothetical protein BA863_07355 [Desulfovibrio sp. S3730MH75]
MFYVLKKAEKYAHTLILLLTFLSQRIHKSSKKYLEATNKASLLLLFAHSYFLCLKISFCGPCLLYLIDEQTSLVRQRDYPLQVSRKGPGVENNYK